MGWDGKYGKVTTELKEIPDDEPVIVFRAQDKTVPGLLQMYRQACMGAGSPYWHLQKIEDTRQRIVEWQKENSDRVKVPD